MQSHQEGTIVILAIPTFPVLNILHERMYPLRINIRADEAIRDFENPKFTRLLLQFVMPKQSAKNIGLEVYVHFIFHAILLPNSGGQRPQLKIVYVGPSVRDLA